MLKAIVNYSKKVPADTEYSSHGYSLSLETEIVPGDASSIHAQLHDAFQLVKASVDQELANAGASGNANASGNAIATPTVRKADAPARKADPAPQQTQQAPQERRKASNKQLSYINSLASNNGIPLSELTAEIQRRFEAASLWDLSAQEASQIIDEMNKAGRRQRAA